MRQMINSGLSTLLRDNFHWGLNTRGSPPFGFRIEKASWLRGETSSRNWKNSSRSLDAHLTTYNNGYDAKIITSPGQKWWANELEKYLRFWTLCFIPFCLHLYVFLKKKTHMGNKHSETQRHRHSQKSLILRHTHHFRRTTSLI